MHSIFYCLYYKLVKHLCTTLEEHFGYSIYLYFIHLLRFKIIIPKPYLVIKSELLIKCN